ncbi:GNAT family N-acetyltransferase [Spirillospora sp. NPDC047279]|uniref:GNAT family N-acetyltransferase n=1 Tax=Spirillospora sp. NPDC047279 TaxID=3155478 RepID=UPI0033FC57DE
MTVPPAPARAADTIAWTSEIRRDDHALNDLAVHLRDLYTRSPAATPFQSPGWFTAWWSQYGRPGALRLALVWRGETLVAAAPLALVRRGPMPVLMPLAGPISDFTDVLVDEAHADEALSRLAATLQAEPGWSALDFSQARPGSAAHRLAGCWPRRTWITSAAVCLELPGDPISAVLAQLPGRAAGKLRSKLRKIDKSGITVSPVPAAEADQAVKDLLALHTLQWQGRGINPEHTRDRFSRHLAAACTDMIRHDEAVIFQYRDAGGRLLASDLLLVGRTLAGAYLYGCLPDLRASVDVTLMLLRQDLGYAHDRGLPVFSLLRGDEAYKSKWRPTTVTNQRLILARNGQALPYATAVRGRALLSRLKHRLPDRQATAQPQPSAQESGQAGQAHVPERSA